MKGKKIIALLLALAMLTVCFTSCGILFGGGDGDNYPDGSIALNELNFQLFFEVKTTASCEYNAERGVTEAVATVTLTPRVKLREAVGKVSFDIGTKVYQPMGNGEWKISNSVQTLLLNNKFVNESYKLTLQGPYLSSDPWRVKDDTVGVSIDSVKGYIIPDAP